MHCARYIQCVEGMTTGTEVANTKTPECSPAACQAWWFQHKQCVQGKIAGPEVATVEAPNHVASPRVVAAQSSDVGALGQQAASPAAVLAEVGQARKMAGGSSQVSLLHVLGTC